ncbi:hypothetical protein [Lentzea flaviverrucosa]|uniref:Uncharacterized protein n=1 Tax=Lentzea flaviverrucosa TaxID=200379 RepID=A0A1H9C3G6_9PSEU|nr:hypothetical protein [Lentzea flaviverrucosa]RDI24430.1 hypothetical protein DFR72_10910 [Lentzea flaviverrucosa]SEP95218.1 hypothetical protein SAMN05216195_101665 [Lentzea flaviverrucosa]
MDPKVRNGMVAMFLTSAAGVATLLLERPLIVPVILFLGACLAGVYVVKQSLRLR